MSPVPAAPALVDLAPAARPARRPGPRAGREDRAIHLARLARTAIERAAS